PISLIGSLYKVIAKVLANRLVTILDDIVDEIQSAFVRWKSVLAAKDVGGLGVSNLFSQKNSLWVRVVKALHGDDRKIGKKVQPRYPSTWLNIINEIESLNNRKSILKAELADLDGVIDKGEGSNANGHRRREVVRLIQEVEKVDAMEVAQKAKIKWSIKGDENSKYYHEIPNRGNSSFITLIPKVPNANVVKDFRPISLIGSLYKVIAKVLANRLVTVLDDIVDEIQSAFVTDRQILDDPFLLNEIVHWCKNKKKQYMIFRVDFEKAYDSVR
nr:RNA-directed DNA polymerase, eukaryota, reverse transcriptase zinc-binding domain protein [Tanacetum cinerariifolium]